MTSGIAEDCALHVRGLELAAGRQELARGRDQGLRDVKTVAAGALGEAEGDGDVVIRGCLEDLAHLWTVDFQGILYVFDAEFEVDWSRPACEHHVLATSVPSNERLLEYQIHAGYPVHVTC